MAKGPKPNPNTDWESIQREYRSGVFSIREIAKMFGISHGLVNRRAKRFPEQWQRDLTKRVRAAVSRKIVSSTVSEDTVSTQGDEEAIIEAAADRALEIIKKHRLTLSRTFELEAKLHDELSEQAKGESTIASKLSAFHALVSAQEKRLRMERAAFGITDDSKPEENQIIGFNIVGCPGIGGEA